MARADRPRPRRRPRLAEAQLSEAAKWVEDGPDRKSDGVIRGRCADLRDCIAAKFDVHLHERSVGKPLKCKSLNLIHRSLSDYVIHSTAGLIGEVDSMLARTRASLAPAPPVLRILDNIRRFKLLRHLANAG